MARAYPGAGALAAAGLLIGIGLATASAAAAERNDIRQFRIGMAVADLPATGYVGFACAADPARALSGWVEYTRCPADAAGRHEVRFQYDDSANPLARVNEGYQGTRVGGHPVQIALLIGADARVDAIRIDTDPHARFYMRKKAFLLADQIKERYGADGWACRARAPTPHAQPIGGVFINQHCEKSAGGRHLVLDQELYRDPDKDIRDFVGGTQFLIERASPADRG